MNVKTTLVLLVLVAAGGVAYWLAPDLSGRLGLAPAQPTAADAGTLRTLQDELIPEKLERIDVQHGQRLVVLERGPGGEWTLPGKWPARKAEVEELIHRLTHLESRFVPIPFEDTADLKRYGLDQPPVTVTVRTAKSSHRLAFGEASDESDRFSRATYLRLDDKPEVLRLAPGLVAALDRPPDYYQQRRLFPSERIAQEGDPQEKIERLAARGIAAKGPTGSFRLEKESDEWKLQEPVHDNVDPERLKTILSAVPDIWAEQFADSAKKDLAEYGLKEPEQTLRVTRSTGDTTLLIGKPSQTKTRTVTRPAPNFGGPPLPPQREVIHDEYRYAKLQDNDQIFEIKADKLKDVFVAANTLRDANLARFRSNDARRLEIKQDSQELVLAKEKEKWGLQKPVQADADSSKIMELLDKLSGLQARDKDILDNADAKAYGLDKPTATITVTVEEESKSEADSKRKKTKSFTFDLGKHDTDKGKLYVKVASQQRINAVEDSILKLVERPALAYRPLQLWQFPVADIKELRVQKEEPGYELKQEDQGWKISGPFEATALVDLTRPMVDALANLHCERYVAHSADDLGTYGLDKPYLRVTLRTAKKEGTKEETSERTLLIGKPTEDKAKTRFAKLEDGPAILVLGEKTVSSVDHAALDLLDRHLLTVQPDTIERIQRKGEDGPLTLERKGADWQVTESPAAPFPADHETMTVLLGVWSNLRAVRFAAYGPKVDLVSYGLDKPAATITLTPKASTEKETKARPVEHTVILGKAVDGTGERFARLDDQPGIVVLAANVVSELTHGYLDFVNRSVLQFDAGKVTSLQRRSGSDNLEIVKRDNGWQLQKPADLPADAQTLNELVGALAKLRAKRVAAYPAKELESFQLENPVATLTVHLTGADGKPETRLLKIGKAVEGTKADADRFAIVGDGTAVFVLPGSLARQLTASPLQFRDRNLAHFQTANRVILERDRRKAVFSKVDGTWKLTEPLSADAEQTDLEDFVNAVANLRVDEVVADKPADLKEYGLDRPEVHWRFQAGDKEVLNLLVGGPEKFPDDAKEKAGRRCYAKLAAGDLVFLLSPDLTAKVQGEYRSRTLWVPLDAAQIEKLSYGYPNKPFVLEKVNNDWHVAGKPDSTVKADVLRETLDALAGLKAARYVVDKNADLKLYGLEPPQLVLEIQTRSGNRVLHIGRPEGESKRPYARVPAENNSAVFVLSESDAGRIIKPLAGFVQEGSKAAANGHGS